MNTNIKMVAYWIHTVAFFSVCCFFAAILSVVIYLHFLLRNARAESGKPIEGNT